MRILDLSAVTDTSQIVLKQGSFVFLQAAYTEMLAGLTLQQIGAQYSTTQVYVVWGCVNTGDTTNYNISAGLVFYNGELFNVDAQTLTVSSGQVATFSLAKSNFTTYADPVTFTDGQTHSVHNIRKLNLVSGSSGSGISGTNASDYSNALFLSKKVTGAIGEIKIWRLPQGDSLSSYFDSTGLGNNFYTNGWAICNGNIHGGIATADLRSRTAVGYDPNSSISAFTMLDGTAGDHFHQLSVSELPSHVHPINSGATRPGVVGLTPKPSGGSVFGSLTNVSGGGSDGGAYNVIETDTSGYDSPHNNIQQSLTVLYIERIFTDCEITPSDTPNLEIILTSYSASNILNIAGINGYSFSTPGSLDSFYYQTGVSGTITFTLAGYQTTDTITIRAGVNSGSLSTVWSGYTTSTTVTTSTLSIPANYFIQIEFDGS